MTTTPSGTRSTSLVRAAGILLAVTAVLGIAIDLYIAAAFRADPSFDHLGATLLPSEIAGDVGLGATVVAFVLLWVWLPKTPGNILFLVFAIGNALFFAIVILPTPVTQGLELAVEIVGIAAGVYATVRRDFSLVACILFLAAMVIAGVPNLMASLLALEGITGVATTDTGTFASVVLAAAGVALFIWPVRRAAPATPTAATAVE